MTSPEKLYFFLRASQIVINLFWFFVSIFLYNKKLLKINTKAKSKVFILKLSVVNDTTIKNIFDLCWF